MPKTQGQAAAQPDCLSIDDAIAAVRACLKDLIGNAADTIDLQTSISIGLPDADDGALQALLGCIKKKTGWELDPRDFSGGSFQGIVDKISCVGSGS
jgi:hypothetical protein